MDEQPLWSESPSQKSKSEAITVRLPIEAVKFIDRGIALGVWSSRAEAGRCLVLAGISAETTSQLGIEDSPSMASGLGLLSQLAYEKAIQSSIQTSLAFLEPILRSSMSSGQDGDDEARRILAVIHKAIVHLPPFWQRLAGEFMNSSKVYRLAMQRFGKVEEW